MDLEVLENIQKKILNSLKHIPEMESFYLTGGTALSAFYLYHRKSNDLDFFTTEEELIQLFSLKVEDALKKKGFEIERSRGFRSFIELTVNSPPESTIIHIALDSPFRLAPLIDSKKFQGLKIDSLSDIAANKLLALFGRATLRDFVDVYFLLKKGFKKNELVDKAEKKDPGFDIYWLGTAFEKINEFPKGSPEMLLLMRPCTLEELQGFFNEWRREIFKEITKE